MGHYSIDKETKGSWTHIKTSLRHGDKCRITDQCNATTDKGDYTIGRIIEIKGFEHDIEIESGGHLHIVEKILSTTGEVFWPEEIEPYNP